MGVCPLHKQRLAPPSLQHGDLLLHRVLSVSHFYFPATCFEKWPHRRKETVRRIEILHKTNLERPFGRRLSYRRHQMTSI